MEKGNKNREAPKKFKRSFWRMVNKDVELKYTLVGVWLIIGGLLIGGVVTYLVIWRNLLILPQLVSPQDLMEIQKKILEMLGVLFILVGILMVALAATLQLRLLHRIAGPLYRLQRAISETATGKLPGAPVRFREKDLYSELADSFNNLVAAIRAGTKFE